MLCKYTWEFTHEGTMRMTVRRQLFSLVFSVRNVQSCIFQIWTSFRPFTFLRRSDHDSWFHQLDHLNKHFHLFTLKIFMNYSLIRWFSLGFGHGGFPFFESGQLRMRQKSCDFCPIIRAVVTVIVSSMASIQLRRRFGVFRLCYTYPMLTFDHKEASCLRMLYASHFSNLLFDIYPRITLYFLVACEFRCLQNWNNLFMRYAICIEMGR